MGSAARLVFDLQYLYCPLLFLGIGSAEFGLLSSILFWLLGGHTEWELPDTICMFNNAATAHRQCHPLYVHPLQSTFKTSNMHFTLEELTNISV